MIKNELLSRLRTCIVENQLFTFDQQIIVGLSGGADSVALLRLLLLLKIDCVAVHCNFHLRGKESDRDEAFVCKLCQEQNIPLYITHFDTMNFAHENKISIEMAARQLRYDYFENLCNKLNINAIAVAHHRDDNVETLFLNLIRGSGIKGLTGIQYKNGKIVRPLLDVSRKELVDFLSELKQLYVTDSTNFEDVAVRNKIRLNVLPLLREINPSLDESLHNTIKRLQDTYSLYTSSINEAAKRVMKANIIEIEKLLKEPGSKTLLFELLSSYGFNSAQVDDIYEHLTGNPGYIYISKEWSLLRDRGKLILNPKTEKPKVWVELPLSGKITLTSECTLEIHIMQIKETEFIIPKQKNILCLDYAKLVTPLIVRTIKEGDRFVPFGMEGSKLVNDYLAEKKKTLFEKRTQLLLCSGEDIVWVIGERSDNRFKIEASTRTVIQIVFSKKFL